MSDDKYFSAEDVKNIVDQSNLDFENRWYRLFLKTKSTVILWGLVSISLLVSDAIISSLYSSFAENNCIIRVDRHHDQQWNASCKRDGKPNECYLPALEASIKNQARKSDWALCGSGEVVRARLYSTIGGNQYLVDE